MIAVTSSGRSFRALSVYLARGHSGREHGRVAWTSPRNLPTDDPELAGKFMRATATQNTRVVKPVYHLAISFDRRDQVSREQMEQVVDKVLDRLGLREHQAILVAHRDREHAHVHVLVNRVHPETGRAWERWKDRPIIEQVLREEERALGLRQINGRLAPVPGREPPEWIAATGLLNGERRAKLRSGTEPFIEHVRTHVPALRKSTSWSEFERALTDRGLRVERAGQGIVITDGIQYVKASRLARDFSLRNLEKRYGIPYDLRHQTGPYPHLDALARDIQRYDHLRNLTKQQYAATLNTTSRRSATFAARLSPQQSNTPSDPQQLERLHEDTTLADRRSRQLGVEISVLPSKADLERTIAVGMNQLLPDQALYLKQLVTADQFSVATQLKAQVRHKLRDLALGREEREPRER